MTVTAYMTNVGHHALFVKSFNSANNEVKCLNSWGPKNLAKPTIKIDSIYRFYRVSCSARQITSTNPATTFQTSTQSPHSQTLNQNVLKQANASSAPDKNDFADKKQIIENWSHPTYTPNLQEIKKAGRLASGGYLNYLKHMHIKGIHLAAVPEADLCCLTSIVEESIIVDNPDGKDILHAIMENAINCEFIYLCNTNIEKNDIPKRITTKMVRLKNVTGDLSKLFQNLECKQLRLGGMVIDANVTQNLQQLLSDFVEVLEIGGQVKFRD